MKKEKEQVGYLYNPGMQEGAKYFMHFISQKPFCLNILYETVDDDMYNINNLNFHSFCYRS